MPHAGPVAGVGNRVRIDHLYGRSVADTDAMAALTHRTPWAVRTVCEREEEGYDVDQCTLQLRAHPREPELVTATQAQHLLGVPAGTIRVWAHRGQLRSYQRNRQGHPLYDAEHIRALNRKPL